MNILVKHTRFPNATADGVFHDRENNNQLQGDFHVSTGSRKKDPDQVYIAAYLTYARIILYKNPSWIRFQILIPVNKM